MCYGHLYKNKPIYPYHIKIRLTAIPEYVETVVFNAYNEWNALAEVQQYFPAPIYSIISVEKATPKYEECEDCGFKYVYVELADYAADVFHNIQQQAKQFGLSTADIATDNFFSAMHRNTEVE